MLRITTELAETTQWRPIVSSPLEHTMAAPWPIQDPSPIRIVPPSVMPCLMIGISISSYA